MNSFGEFLPLYNEPNPFQICNWKYEVFISFNGGILILLISQLINRDFYQPKFDTHSCYLKSIIYFFFLSLLLDIS